MDLLIRDARLADGRRTDVAIEDSAITRVGPGIDATARSEIDADGDLLLPAFVNGQLHACKSFWRRPLAQLPEAVLRLPRFEAFARVKRAYTVDDVAERVDETVRLALLHGCCALRLFADVDEASGLTALEGVLRVCERWRSILPIQVVAFPQDGASPATERLMQQALDRGADVVGGIPWIEEGEAAQREHVELCFDLAAERDLPLHFVCDDTPDPASRTLAMVAEATVARGLEHRVAVTQCAALAFYDDAEAERTIERVARAGLTVFSNAHVSLVTTERRREPWPRGITRVQELLAAGVPVACAQDDIDNPYYPFGRNDPLELALFMAHAAGLAWPGDSARTLPMVTEVPARALALAGYPGLELREGARADLVLVDAPDWHEALRRQADRRVVVVGGRIAARTERTQRVTLEP